MLNISRSHRLETLAQALCRVLAKPCSPDPFEPEWVVVQNLGMGRWLRMQVAQGLGVAANLRFLLPGDLVQEALDAALGGPSAGRWRCETLVWVLLDLLPDLARRPEAAPLASYLGGEVASDAIGRREMALAIRLAETFDRYLVFRRDIVRAWDQGEEPCSWQAIAWREVRSRLGPPDPAERVHEFLARCAAGEARLEGFPRRVCVFGASALPPLHLEVLHALARDREVHLFVLAPSREWFGDALTPAEAAHRREACGVGTEPHPLLAALGRLSRDFQVVLEECQERWGVAVEGPEDLFADHGPARTTMLARLQADLVAGVLPQEPHPLSKEDTSIRVHACHGPMRQVEVVRDALLALFEADRTLEPRDVLVMCPDIEAYAPLIEAVFGEGAQGAGFPVIPYQVADRSMARENPAAEVVSRILRLAGGKVPASEVLDLLSLPLVARRFGMSAEDLAQVREFVRAARIRWGLDEAHRLEHGYPGDENTWRFGLERLLLGFAMSGEERRLFANVVPCEAASGRLGALERFIEFSEVLMAFVRRARDPKSLREWVRDTEEVLAHFVPKDDEGQGWALEARQAARRVLDDAGDGPSRPLQAEAWLAVWEGRVLQPSRAGAFFRGGVTFSALVPLRSLPFRVIVLMGLDDGTFPRQGQRVSFDLLAQERRAGDRSARDEDLQLFLEAILSARDHLIITYTGRGLHDNAPLPPAVPVGQLLDALDASFRTGDGRKPSEAVLVSHPMHPYSPAAFGRDDFRTFDQRYESAARALRARVRVPPRPRFDRPLPTREEGVVALSELARFFMHPIRYLLRYLGVEVELEAVTVEDRVPPVVAGLERYEVSEEVAQALLREVPADLLFQYLQRAGLLPPGNLARVEFERVLGDVLPLVREVRTRVTFPAREALVTLEVGGARIEGVLGNVFPEGLAAVTTAKAFQKKILSLWVQHLVATLALDHYGGRAWLFSQWEGGSVCLEPIEKGQARTDLEDLVSLYRLGLTVPIPLFPKSSYAFVADSGAMVAARREWTQWDGSGEGQDPHVRFVFGEVSSPEEVPLPEGVPGFQEVAKRVFGPIVKVLKVLNRHEV